MLIHPPWPHIPQLSQPRFPNLGMNNGGLFVKAVNVVATRNATVSGVGREAK